MSHAEICPVCFGKGSVESTDDWRPKIRITCHGCGGKGWVTVYGDSRPLPIVYDKKPEKIRL